MSELSPTDYQWYMRLAMVNIEPRDPNYARFEQLRRRHLAWAGDTTLERQAIHQAGHAVVAQALGWKVKDITLSSHERCVQVELPPAQDAAIAQRVARFHQWVRQRLAGVVAEEIEWGMAREPETGILAQIMYRRYLLDSAATTLADRRVLRDAFPCVGANCSAVGEALSLIECEEARARETLIKRWMEVERLAGELLILT